MSSKLPPALCALAIVMLVGCKQPAHVHTAFVQTARCTVGASQSLSGYVDWYEGLNYYVRTNPTINWGYVADENGHADPRSNGFCVFDVPEFHSPDAPPVCTLFFFQTAHSGSQHLKFKWLFEIPTWPVQDSVLYWAVETGGRILTTYDSNDSDSCWWKVVLPIAPIESIGEGGGGPLVTGWRYDGSTSGTYAEADGATQTNPPYIKVVYYGP